MDQSEAIRIAFDFLKAQSSFINDDMPVLAVTFDSADDFTPYARWTVLFETCPGCQPDFTVVEIVYPDMNPQIIPMI